MKMIFLDKLRGPMAIHIACLLVLMSTLLANPLIAFACTSGNNPGQGQGNKNKSQGNKGVALVKLQNVVVIANPVPVSSNTQRSIKAAPTSPAQPLKMTIEEKVLTTAQGFPLYYYDDDKKPTKPDCNKITNQACTIAWPPLLQTNGTSLTVAGLSVKLVAVQNVNGQQITCLGHPLYTYIQDKMPLIALGDGRDGGKWHVATPNTPPLAVPA